MDPPHSADYLMVNQMMDQVFLKYRIETMNRELRAMENDSVITMNNFFKQKKKITYGNDHNQKENKVDSSSQIHSSKNINVQNSHDKNTQNKVPCGSGYIAAKHLR